MAPCIDSPWCSHRIRTRACGRRQRGPRDRRRRNAPEELLVAAADPNVLVRRSAVKALGSFDDPTTAETIDQRTEDEDREVALRAAEALLALARRPRAAPEARARLESSSAWAVEYAGKIADVANARKVAEVTA